MRRVRRALALTTIFTALAWIPAPSAVADPGAADPSTVDDTTSSTLTTPTTPPASDPTTTTTTTPEPSSNTDTTTSGGDEDEAGGPSTSTSTTTTTTSTSGPEPSTTSTSPRTSGPPGGSGRSTTTTTSRPSSSPPTAAATSSTAAPARPPADVAVVDSVASDSPAGGDDPGTGGGAATPSAGSGRTTRPSPARPEGPDLLPAAQLRYAEPDAPGTPDPHWFDASGAGGLLGLEAALAPAGTEAPAVDADRAAGSLAAALGERDGTSRPSPALLGLSLLILLGLAGGLAFRWWDRRPGRYWPA